MEGSRIVSPFCVTKPSRMSCFNLVLDKPGRRGFDSIFFASQRSSLGSLIICNSSSTITSNFLLLIVSMNDNLNQSLKELNRDGSKSLQFLKILVVVMGIMIIAGVTVVVVTIFQRITAKANFSSGTPYSVTKEMSKNLKLQGINLGDGEIALQLQDKNGATLIIVYNVSDGREVGRFNFNFSQ